MTLTIIDHTGYDYRSGTRILLLKGRRKDGVEQENTRTILKISHDPDQWDRRFNELLETIQPGERIYATAGARNMAKAIREFKERQLSADYDQDQEAFYREIHNRWTSCLMAPKCQDGKVWLIDLDNDIEETWYNTCFNVIRPLVLHNYRTKNGLHVLVRPFNKEFLPDKSLSVKISDNALMLIAY